jgi:hypothetical protein
MTDPFSTEALVEWLRKQPANRRYEYTDSCGCLLAQYFHSVIKDDVLVSDKNWHELEAGKEHPLPQGWNDISLGRPSQRVRTFGQALARAEALLEREKSE